MVPAKRPSNAPIGDGNACAASSTTGTSPATSSSPRRSAGSPAMWTTSIARVRSVIAAATADGSAFAVVGSTSTRIGVALRYSATSADAANVYVGTITSSASPTPMPSSARWSAAVALFTATAWRTPAYAANASSNAAVRAPMVSQPDSRTAIAASRSLAPRDDRWNGIRSSVTRGSAPAPGPADPASFATRRDWRHGRRSRRPRPAPQAR